MSKEDKMIQPAPAQPDVTSEAMKTLPHETWNTCMHCGDSWQTTPRIPGVLHRSTLCTRCSRRQQ